MSTKDSPLAIAQTFAIQYFNEFRDSCMKTPNLIISERTRWDAISEKIYSLPLEEQAEYADCVIKRLCSTLHPDILIPYIYHNLDSDLAPFKENPEINNACVIGNTALMILSLPESPEKEHYKSRFLTCLK